MRLSVHQLLLLTISLISFSCNKNRTVSDYHSVRELFAAPTSEYRSVPLWVWNDQISKTRIDEQLNDFHTQGIGGVFIHPRPGLITSYLSREWLDMVTYTVEQARAIGLKVWIYDENSYPSGFAGGHVPAIMPESIGQGLRFGRYKSIPDSIKPLIVLKRQGQFFSEINPADCPSGGDYYVFDLVRDEPSSWYGGYFYVDLLQKPVTEKFLQITMDAYKSVIGHEFGKTVPGVFQDEAHPAPVWRDDVLNYTPALFSSFQRQWGYDLKSVLPCLFEEIGNWRQVRHNYYAVILGLFIDNFAQPYYDYCKRNNLIFTGHYWEHRWINPLVGPDNMAMYAYAHMPGIDILMNQWNTDPMSQFGNNRSVKELRSAANQLGQKRTLSETYGAGGWELSFCDQKRIGDWQYALGVNFLNQHLSYMTIMGARKRDHPQSFSYHEPWWPAYKNLADYFSRLSVAMSCGEQINRILVIEPTSTLWMYYDRTENAEMDSLSRAFQNFINRLESAQIEYDLGSETIMKNHGLARDAALVIGKREYQLVIIPPGLETLDGFTVELLQKYIATGGRVLSCVEPPRYRDGQPNDIIRNLAGRFDNWMTLTTEACWKQINAFNSTQIVLQRVAADSGYLFHHRRIIDDGQLLFLVNSSDRHPSTGIITLPGSGVEEWDPFTGSVTPYPARYHNDSMTVAFSMPPGGSLLLALHGKPAQQSRPALAGEQSLAPADLLRISPEQPNVLTLDYCDLQVGTFNRKNMYFCDAQSKIFEHYGFSTNPWDNAIQYKTEIVDKDHFPANSSFQAAYKFRAEPEVDFKSLRLVIERPSLWQVFVNDAPITATPGQWWLDKAFGVFDIGRAVRSGENTVVLHAIKMTIHSELEPIYLLGQFSLQAAKIGFNLTAAKPLQKGSWSAQGWPFYSRHVVYAHTWILPEEPQKNERFSVQLGDWNGAYAGVSVNGIDAGMIAFLPYSLDVTRFLQKGENVIRVAVCGTLRNLLGPHHNRPTAGQAYPRMFRQGASGGIPPGSEYSVLDYGMNTDFSLIKYTLQDSK